MRQHVRNSLIATFLLSAVIAAASPQLGSRPANEWNKTLDDPARVAALKIDEVVAAMKLQPGQTVADIGAGTGLFEVPLAKAVGPKGRVYAEDVDAGFFPAIRKRAAEAQLTNVETVLGQYTDPALPVKSADLALMHDVIHHVEKRAEYIKALATYLGPAGRIVVVDYEPGRGPHRDQPALEVSRQQLTGWMRDAGLTQVEDVKLFADKYFLVFARAPQSKSVLGPAPVPQLIPSPAPATDRPYAPQTILPGGVVVPLFPPDSPFLNKARVNEAEIYNMSSGVPGRVGSIVNIHNPSIEFHRVPAAMNTGAVVIVVAGGGHNTLNVGSEGADFVPFFYNYGINTAILRNRLRRDGYNPQVDAVNDMLQAIKVVRAYADDWALDALKIGAIGFSAGAELTAPAALKYVEFDRAQDTAGNPLAKISSRPDFVGLIYPGPSPFRGGAAVPIPDDAPPAFIASGGTGDAVHAAWADEFFAAFLRARIPNLEMHIYGNGVHPGQPLPDGATMTAGLTDRNGMPFGTWQYRFIDWFRDLGFTGKPGVETKAARESSARAAHPPSSR